MLLLLFMVLVSLCLIPSYYMYLVTPTVLVPQHDVVAAVPVETLLQQQPDRSTVRQHEQQQSLSNDWNHQSNQQQKSSIAQKQHLPLFLLHVGLPKTGTTFLQCSLCANANHTEPVLQQDNLVYLGTCPVHSCGLSEWPNQFIYHWHPSFFPNGLTKEAKGNALGPFPYSDLERVDTREKLPRLEPDFMQRVNAVRKQGNQHAMLVFEGCHIFSNRHIQALANFLRPQWNVHIVVAYRPLYDWLPSKYNSVNKPARNPAADAWPNQTVPDYPDLVGAPILPFDLDHRHEFSELVADLEQKYQQHPTQIVRDNYARHFGDDHVHIMPLHLLQQQQQQSAQKGKGDPMLVYLFCFLIPRLLPPQQGSSHSNYVDNPEDGGTISHTCNEVLRGTMDHGEQANPSEELSYDLLAVEAYNQGLFRVTDPSLYRTQRGTVGWKVQKRQERVLKKTAKDFPVECLSNATLQRLEQMSLLMERKLFISNKDNGLSKNDWTDQDEQALRAGFQKAVAKRKYCHVDTKKVLADPEWRLFFKRIGEKKTRNRRANV